MNNFVITSIFTTMLLGASFTAAVGSAGSNVELAEKIVHYEFEAEPGANVRQAMYDASPLFTKGGKSAGRTAPVYHYDIDYERSTNGCRMSKVRILVKAMYTLPKWINYKTAAPELRNEWDRFYTALLLHEKAHGQFSVQTAERMIEETKSLPYQKNCTLVWQRFKEMTDQLIKTDQLDEEFDKRTRHGFTEGVFLNIPSRSMFSRIWSGLFN